MNEFSLEDKLRKASLIQIYRNSKIGISGLFITFLFVIFLLKDEIAIPILALGALYHASILLWRVYRVYGYNKVKEYIDTIEEVEFWISSYRTGSFALGIGWGLLFLFLGDVSTEYQLILFIMIISLMTVGIFTLGSMPSIYLAFMVPISVVTFIWMLFQHGMMYDIMAFILAVWAIYCYIMIKSHAEYFKDAIIEKEKNLVYTQNLEEANKKLKELKERMELALIGSNDGLWDWNLLDNSVYLSPRWKEMLGFDSSRSIDKYTNWEDRIHPDDVDRVVADIQDNIDGKTEFYENVHRLKHKDGHWVWILDRGKTHYDENGKPVRMIGTHTDITQEKEMQLKYVYQAQIIEQVNDSVISITLYGIITSWNIGSELLLGYKASEMIGKHITSIYMDKDSELLRDGIKKTLETGRFSTETHLVKKSGAVVPIELSLSLLRDENGEASGIICYAQNITERKAAQAKLHYQAHYDSLTDLPNRVLFSDRLNHSVDKASRRGLNIALLFIDLDRFKQINDSLGHDVGDMVLKVVAQRLKSVVRKEDTLSRLGGDEFTVIMENLEKTEDASVLAKKILEILKEPININGHTLYASSSIGISLYPDDSLDAHDLIKYADIAMYKAKEDGRNNFQFYSYEMTEMIFERVMMEENLREALKNNELVTHYQPQIDARKNKIVGMEALVRWKHPTLGLIFPSKFIKLAEENGLILEIDKFMMKTAMKQFKSWYDEGFNPGILALNLTVKQLERDDFLEMLEDNLKKYEFKPEWLELEITEGELMKKLDSSIVKLQEIHNLGIRVAIDDFGTGYSSLSYLKKLPIDKLKIDQAFVRDIPNNEEDSAIVKAIIALSQSLNLEMVAEGVETDIQREFLLENSCNNIQGHYYSRAIPSNEMDKYLIDDMNPLSIDEKIDLLIKTSNLHSREEIINNPSTIPADSGICAWFFKDIPNNIPLENSFKRDGFSLLFLGSAPNKKGINSNLRKGIVNQHLKGNVHDSTLRFSLACLLQKQLNITFSQHSSRISLGDDEERLDEWLNKNARVAYLTDAEAGTDKVEMIKKLDLPLNIEHNKEHPFYVTLKKLRADAKKEVGS